MKRYAEPFIHLVFWFLLGYLAYNSVATRVIAIKGADGEFQQMSRNFPEQIYLLLIDFSFKGVLFYLVSLVLLPKYLMHRSSGNLIKLVVSFVGTFLISFVINFLIMDLIIQPSPMRVSRLFSLSILLHFFTMLVAIAYSLIKERFQTERLQKEIQEEKLKTELTFLKSQLNPHFLFNTLNNLFAESNKSQNHTLSSGIAKLSHMMRYMLHESNESFVALSKEIAYLKSYVELEMLRMSSDDPFTLEIDIGDHNPSLLIAPLIFQPIVENAFKHGVTLESASYVNISLSTRGSTLHFSIKNSRSTDSRQFQHSGVGLTNIKRRLELIYPESYLLEINENTSEFEVILELELERKPIKSENED